MEEFPLSLSLPESSFPLSESPSLSESSSPLSEPSFPLSESSSPTLSSSPFSSLRISSHSPLRAVEERHVCEGCKKSVRYFCYRCVRLAPGLEVPQVSLPLELLVVKHARELEGKSTAVHAKLLAPEDVTLTTYDPKTQETMDRLAALDPNESVLLFPDETAQRVDEIDWRDVKRLVVIDGTWQQAKAMVKSSCLQHLTRRVKLNESNKTLFWRYQQIGPHCLSTIEAVHHFFQELHQHQHGQTTQAFDDLLYIFSFFYGLIQDDYAQNPDRRYTAKHRQDYITKRPKHD
ncbi:DTW domain-containing protein [Paramicrosporidium saccamoebae]|uniref:tRNA-uridine aminocarboxypropyltransferase 1 n=1 Tax=Paramicrosporidium saccamoebae TaxID=1246581 RepID=A0A2H9TGN8_9FUNG|nr:DTW domain-containing protein [Paramicrosporidium saccamoebae]